MDEVGAGSPTVQHYASQQTIDLDLPFYEGNITVDFVSYDFKNSKRFEYGISEGSQNQTPELHLRFGSFQYQSYVPILTTPLSFLNLTPDQTFYFISTEHRTLDVTHLPIGTVSMKHQAYLTYERETLIEDGNQKIASSYAFHVLTENGTTHSFSTEKLVNPTNNTHHPLTSENGDLVGYLLIKHFKPIPQLLWFYFIEFEFYNTDKKKF